MNKGYGHQNRNDRSGGDEEFGTLWQSHFDCAWIIAALRVSMGYLQAISKVRPFESRLSTSCFRGAPQEDRRVDVVADGGRACWTESHYRRFRPVSSIT
jgi:hypothetical protein